MTIMKREVLNKLLLMKTIELSKKIKREKLMYMVFILEEEGRKEEKLTFNYEFVKWGFEPFSTEIERDIEHLVIEGLVKSENGLVVTKKGIDFMGKYNSFYSWNKVNKFFKYFIYLNINSSLYEVVNYINKKYSIARYPTKGVILEIRDEYKTTKSKFSKTKNEIDSTYKQLNEKEEKCMKRINKLLSEINKTEVG